jgi:hypothetical protein
LVTENYGCFPFYLNNLSSKLRDYANKSLETINIVGLAVSLTSPLEIDKPAFLTVLTLMTFTLLNGDNTLAHFILSLLETITQLPKM